MLPLLALAALLSSCSSSVDSDPPCSIENDLALQTGNWWVYQAWDTDIHGAKIAGTERVDSVVVESTQILLGKTAYMLVSYSSKDGGMTLQRDTSWLAVESGRAYRLSSDLGVLFCECLENTWIPFADCERDSWAALDTSIIERAPLRTLDSNGKEVILMSATRRAFASTGVKGSLAAFSVTTGTVQAREYRLHNVLDFQLIEPTNVQLFEGTRRVVYANESKVWVAGNIGIVKVERTAYTRQPVSTVEPVFSGVVKNLLRYSVK